MSCSYDDERGAGVIARVRSLCSQERVGVTLPTPPIRTTSDNARPSRWSGNLVVQQCPDAIAHESLAHVFLSKELTFVDASAPESVHNVGLSCVSDLRESSKRSRSAHYGVATCSDDVSGSWVAYGRLVNVAGMSETS